MLSKQNMIHIATDVVLITMLFVYINNKSKAANDAIEELREYTEEQIDNINNKLDNLIKYVMKQKQQQQPISHIPLKQPQPQPQYQQPQPQYQQPQPQPQYQQPQPQPQSTKKVQKTVKFSDNLSSNEQVKPVVSTKSSIKTSTNNVQLSQIDNFTHSTPFNSPDIVRQNSQIDDFINSIPQSIAFISTTQFHPSELANQRQNTQIEIINEEVDEENTTEDISMNQDEDDEANDLNDLDDLDMQEIENALSGDIKVSDDNKSDD